MININITAIKEAKKLKTIKIIPKNLKNKSASIITIVILFAMIMFTISAATEYCVG